MGTADPAGGRKAPLRSGAAAVYGASAAQRTMATDENNHKNEARDDWTGCTFRVERGPSSEGRAWGMADILE